MNYYGQRGPDPRLALILLINTDPGLVALNPTLQRDSRMALYFMFGLPDCCALLTGVSMTVQRGGKRGRTRLGHHWRGFHWGRVFGR